MAGHGQLKFVMTECSKTHSLDGAQLESVYISVSSYNIRPENVYLLHDDIEKGLGQLSVKEMGSAK